MKTKFYKLIFLPVLIIIFTACMGAEPEVVPTFETGGELDFEGFDFTILPEYYDLTDNFMYAYGTANHDRLQKRISDIETELNCKITPVYKGHSGVLNSYISTCVASGVYAGEMLTNLTGNAAADFAAAGLLYPLSEFTEIIDYESEPEKYGPMNVLETVMSDGEAYMVTPVALPEVTESFAAIGVFVINEDLVSLYNVTDPREYYENKTWTWESFEKAVDEMSFSDAEKEYRAFHATQAYFVRNAVLSNGMTYVSEDTSGKLIPGLSAGRVTEALDWVKKLLTEHENDILILQQDIWAAGQTSLLDYDVFMAHVSTIHVTNFLSKTVENFGVVPFPCGASVPYGQWSCELVAANGFSILANAREPEGSAHVLNRLFEPFEGLETKEKLIDDAERSMYFKRSDAEVMMSISDYGSYFYWNFGGDAVWTKIADSINSMSSTQLVESYASEFSTFADEYVVPNYEYIKSVGADRLKEE